LERAAPFDARAVEHSTMSLPKPIIGHLLNRFVAPAINHDDRRLQRMLRGKLAGVVPERSAGGCSVAGSVARSYRSGAGYAEAASSANTRKAYASD